MHQVSEFEDEDQEQGQDQDEDVEDEQPMPKRKHHHHHAHSMSQTVSMDEEPAPTYQQDPREQMSQEQAGEDDDDFGVDAESYYNPKTVDPRDRFSIPSQELRRERYDRLQQAEADKEHEKREREAAVIDRNSKTIIEKNKKNVRQNSLKFSKVERDDLLSRQELHKALKRQRSDYKMNKDLEKQMQEETLQKRANQINTAVNGVEKSESQKLAEAEAEEDYLDKQDQQNQMLEKKLKKELEKEERHLEKEKKKLKETQTKGWDRPDKF